MPIYEYRCPSCATSFERFERVGSTATDICCPNCQREGATRIPSRFASGTASCGPTTPGGAGST